MKKVIDLLIGFGILGLIGYGIFKSLVWFYNQVLSIDPRISAALITGLLAIIATSLSITIPKYLEKKMEIEEHLRDKKSQTYKELVELLFKILMDKKINDPVIEKEIIKITSKFTENLILWGSEEVITSYKSFRMYFINHHAGKNLNIEAIRALENLLLAIRKDMGHKNRNLKDGDILSLFINDIDEILEKLKAS